MYCLYCGDCCKRMSPISNPCPYIIQIDTYIFCSIYQKRPKECSNHEFDTRFCLIGLDVLKFDSNNPSDIDKIRFRIDDGDEKIQKR